MLMLQESQITAALGEETIDINTPVDVTGSQLTASIGLQ